MTRRKWKVDGLIRIVIILRKTQTKKNIADNSLLIKQQILRSKISLFSIVKANQFPYC